jgi:hypothetical protein
MLWGDYSTLQVQAPANANVFLSDDTLSMHVNGSTNGQSSSIQVIKGNNNNIVLGLMFPNTVNIIQDNPVQAGSGFSWTLFATDGNDIGSQVTGDVTHGTGWTNLSETNGNGSRAIWTVKAT